MSFDVSVFGFGGASARVRVGHCGKAQQALAPLRARGGARGGARPQPPPRTRARGGREWAAARRCRRVQQLRVTRAVRAARTARGRARARGWAGARAGQAARCVLSRRSGGWRRHQRARLLFSPSASFQLLPPPPWRDRDRDRDRLRCARVDVCVSARRNAWARVRALGAGARVARGRCAGSGAASAGGHRERRRGPRCFASDRRPASARALNRVRGNSAEMEEGATPRQQAQWAGRRAHADLVRAAPARPQSRGARARPTKWRRPR